MIAQKGATVAKERNWEFFAVEGGHMEGFMDHVSGMFTPNLPSLVT